MIGWQLAAPNAERLLADPNDLAVVPRRFMRQREVAHADQHVGVLRPQPGLCLLEDLFEQGQGPVGPPGLLVTMARLFMLLSVLGCPGPHQAFTRPSTSSWRGMARSSLP